MSKSVRRRIPKYCHHKARNLARVTIDGKDHYLGEYGSPESKQRYQELIAEWLETQNAEVQVVRADTRMCELMVAYLKHCQSYYRKDGELTREYGCIKEALREVRKLFELDQVDHFGPKSLKEVRTAMVALGWSRKYINKQVGRIVRMFKWGVGEQIVRSTTWQALTAVEGLKMGRTQAPDHPPVEPVAEDIVAATLPHLSSIIADMVRLQQLTGSRPGEICLFRPIDIDRSAAIWKFIPRRHKTEHQGRKRVIWIGPQAQEILSPYLERDPRVYCFDPREVPNAKENAGRRYTKDSYGRAVRRAAKKAGVERWSPNRLRHSAATNIRREFGLEAAQTILGHASAQITEIYAERDAELAQTVASRIG